MKKFEKGLARISHKFSGNSNTLSSDLDSQHSKAVLLQHCPCHIESQSQLTKDRFFPRICEKYGLIFLFLLLPFTLFAEEWTDPNLPYGYALENDPPPFYPIAFSGSYLRVSPAHFKTPGFKNDTLQYTQTETSVAVTYPCTDYCGFIFGAGWIGTELERQNNPDFDQKFFNYINSSLGVYTKAFPDWTWTFTLAANLDTAQFSLIDYALYNGVLSGRYHCSESLELDFGMIVEIGLKKEQIWPIIGFIYFPFQCLRISAVYPIDLSVEYYFLSYWSAGGSIRFLRNRHRLKPNEPNPQGIFEYRTTGAEFDLTFSPFARFSVTGFAGRTLAGGLKVSNRNDHEGTDYKLKGSFYAGGELILAF